MHSMSTAHHAIWPLSSHMFNIELVNMYTSMSWGGGQELRCTFKQDLKCTFKKDLKRFKMWFGLAWCGPRVMDQRPALGNVL